MTRIREISGSEGTSYKNKVKSTPSSKTTTNVFSEAKVHNSHTAKIKPSVSKQTPAVKLIAQNKQDVVKLTDLSPDYINKLISFEGFELKEYKDVCGIKSIGIGHNIKADSSYKFGKKITEAQAYHLLAKDLLEAEKDLKELIGDIPLAKGQKEALVDLVFNVGAGKLKNTKLLTHINKGKFDDAAKEFDFIQVNGATVSPLLCKRRIDNLNRFYGSKQTLASVRAMEYIKGKGETSYDEKIEDLSGKTLSLVKAKSKKFNIKAIVEYEKQMTKYMRQSREFGDETTKVIEHAKKYVHSFFGSLLLSW